MVAHVQPCAPPGVGLSRTKGLWGIACGDLARLAPSTWFMLPLPPPYGSTWGEDQRMKRLKLVEDFFMRLLPRQAHQESSWFGRWVTSSSSPPCGWAWRGFSHSSADREVGGPQYAGVRATE